MSSVAPLQNCILHITQLQSGFYYLHRMWQDVNPNSHCLRIHLMSHRKHVRLIKCFAQNKGFAIPTWSNY